MSNSMIKKMFCFVTVITLAAFMSVTAFSVEETQTTTVQETTTQPVETTTQPEETTTQPEETTTQPEETTTQPEKPDIISGFVEENGDLYYYSPETGEKVIPGAGVYKIEEKAYLFSEDGKIIKYNPQKAVTEFKGGKYCISEDNSLASSLQKIDGSTYYFDEVTCKMKTGWITLKDGKRYFSEKNGAMLTGFRSVSGKYYYFDNNGIMTTGWVDFKEGRRRFHLKTGAMLTGFKTFSGNSYYFDKEGIMQTGWVKFKQGKRRFHLKTGAMLKGVKKVEGKYYYFNSKGFMKTGWITVGNDKYYFEKSTCTSAKGWKKLKGEYYYFMSNGKMAKNTIVGSYYLLNDGTRATDTAVKQAVKVVKAATNNKMTKEQKLKACYNWIIKNFSYQRDYQDPARLKNNWTKAYAEYAFRNKRGNCYKYASAMGYCAEVLGYDARVVYGKIASGSSRTNHGWTEIRIDGKYYIFDTVQADYYKGNYYKRTYSNYPRKLYKSGTRSIVLS
ncbi:MAG: hypothetical protein IJ491_04630 [Clostridia bacterium]|nr:hypothetical protein [Clostridia bacterium]